MDGAETVPVYYESQGRHYMAVMDMDQVTKAPFFVVKPYHKKKELSRFVPAAAYIHLP